MVRSLVFVLLLGEVTIPGRSADPDGEAIEAIEAIKQVGAEGHGNAEASAAWRLLAAGDAVSIPALLRAMKGAGPVAQNWLRAAVETIADRSLAAGERLSVAELERLVRAPGNGSRGRELAYELIDRVSPARAEALLPDLRSDPSSELRRLALAELVREADILRAEGNAVQANLRFREVLAASRDVAQIEEVVKRLREAGQEVDLGEVFGWVSHWKVIGPFDNTGLRGFAEVFAPERSVKLTEALEGKNGPVTWRDFQAGEYGVVNVNEVCGSLKGATAYAYAEVVAPRDQEVELRLGSENAWKLWLNGAYLFGRDEYHRGMEIDQYRIPTKLKRGRNRFLVKVCQDEEVEEWTVKWDFQLRICDLEGATLRFDEVGEPIEP